MTWTRLVAGLPVSFHLAAIKIHCAIIAKPAFKDGDGRSIQ